MKLIAAYFSLVLVASSLSAVTESRVSYSAAAFALDGEHPLYVEKHIETWRDGRLAEREVRYEEPSGHLIAEKFVRYGDSPAAPSFEMTDYRIGLREGAEVDSGRVLLYSGPIDREDRRRSVDRPDLAVVDAGFDAFMRENFASVAAGETIEFDFAVPALRRFFKFELVPRGEVVYRSQPAYLIKMRPASALLRLAVDAVDLIYSPSGRLLEFRGLANLCDVAGDRYKARIVFDYPQPEPATFAAGATP